MAEYTAITPDGKYLVHYGVKGMKWGKHKNKKQYASTSSANNGLSSYAEERTNTKSEKTKYASSPDNSVYPGGTTRTLDQKRSTSSKFGFGSSIRNPITGHNVLKKNASKNSSDLTPTKKKKKKSETHTRSANAKSSSSTKNTRKSNTKR